MSAPPTEPPATLSTSGYEDGLGRRTLVFDREDGVMLERLSLRPELTAFEQAFLSRMARLAAFEDERFARIRALERDATTGGLTVISEFVAGTRLSDVLESEAQMRDENAPPSVDVALGFLLELLPALGLLHATAGLTHGAVGPGRMVLTPFGQIVLMDDLFGAALERLKFTRSRLWKEFRIATPLGAQVSGFGIAGDIAQATLGAVSILVGRPLREDDYPDGLPSVLMEVVEIAQLRGSAAFAENLQRFFQRTLPLPGQRPYATTEDAVVDLQHLVRGEIGIDRCRAALTEFASVASRISDAALPMMADSPAAAAPRPRPAPAPAVKERPALIAKIVELFVPPPSVARPPSATPSAIVPPRVPLNSVPAEQPSTPVTTKADAYPNPVAGTSVASAAGTGEATEIPRAKASQQPDVRVPSTPADILPAAVALPEPPAGPEAQSLAPHLPAEPVHTAPPAATTPVPPAAVAAPPPAHAGNSRWKRSRSPKAKRDRLRSITAPPAPAVVAPAVVVPAVVVPAVVAPAVAAPVAAPAPPRAATPLVPVSAAETIWEAPVIPPAPPEPFQPPSRLPAPIPLRPQTETRWQPPAAQVPVAPVPPMPVAYGAAPPGGIRLKVEPPAAAPTGGIRLKAEPPAAHVPVREKPRRQPESDHFSTRALGERNRPDDQPTSRFPWKLAAAAVLVMVVAGGAGRAYLPDREKPKSAEPSPAPAPVEAPAAPTTGSLTLSTQPPGARVMLDGKPAGETPLTLAEVSRGRHIVTFMTSGGAVKRVVRIEAGKTLSLDVPVYSGWVGVYAPISLEISENGHTIGTTEQGHLMLPPGDHTLTLTNRDLGYTARRTVTIEAGEERSITIEPRGALNLNAVPWAEVWIDGQKAGETPMANFQVPLGTREIIFRHPQYGERKVTATVKATAATALSIDFTKPSQF